MIGCSDASDQKGDININPGPDHAEIFHMHKVDPPPPHLRIWHDPYWDKLQQDSEALYELYMDIVYSLRMTPVLLDEDSGFFIDNYFHGYFSFRSITEEGHVPDYNTYNHKNGNVSPEHFNKFLGLLLSQLREPVPLESIHLLLSEYQMALDSIPINWNSIRACLDISRARFQLQRLPELLPLHKQVFDQARSYDESFDEFICYTINSSLHTITMHHSEEALQIVDAALNPEYWEEPDEEMNKKLPTDCKNLSEKLRGIIIDHMLPVLATEEEILEILHKWKDYYPLIPEDNMEVPHRTKYFNQGFNIALDSWISGNRQSRKP